jgi:hypothetical protein
MRKTDAIISAANSATKKKPRGRPFKPENPWRMKPGETRNPSGRPKLLSDAYREWLAHEDDEGVTNAAKVAVKVGTVAASGDIQAARELRQSTEGDKFNFDFTKLTDEQLERIQHGENPAIVLASSGGGGVGTEAPAAESNKPEPTGSAPSPA